MESEVIATYTEVTTYTEVIATETAAETAAETDQRASAYVSRKRV